MEFPFSMVAGNTMNINANKGLQVYNMGLHLGLTRLIPLTRINVYDNEKSKGKKDFLSTAAYYNFRMCQKHGKHQYVNDRPNDMLNLSKPIVKRTEPLLVTVNNSRQ